MTARPTRRALAVGLLAAIPAPAVALTVNVDSERGARLPEHAALWRRLPLPFTPAQAWRRLDAETQGEIGAAVIGMALAEYVGGDGMAEADQFLDADLRHAADAVQHDLLNAITPRLWTLFPDLYGPEGDHPRWALDAGMVHPLGTVLPEPPGAPSEPDDEADPVFAAIERARGAEATFTAALAALPDDPTDEQEEAAERVGRASDRADDALLTTRPTTFDGIVALLAYLGETVITDGGRDHVARLAASLADGPPIG